MYLSYFGIRVTNLRRSTEFYQRLFGLELPPESDLPSAVVDVASSTLLIDPRSHLRIELNYYPPGNPYAVPYDAGEGFDHLAFRVDDLPKFLDRLRGEGIEPERMKHYDGPMMSTPTFRVAYFRDPDGNQIEVFDSPDVDPNQYDPHRY